MSRLARQRSEKTGRRAELIAMLYLRVKGYHIITRREKSPVGEIDLIACKGGTLIFIEVKYRRERSRFDLALTPQSQKRIMRAAAYLTSRREGFQKMGQRFDVIFISPRGMLPYGRVHHLKDAWRAR